MQNEVQVNEIAHFMCQRQYQHKYFYWSKLENVLMYPTCSTFTIVVYLGHKKLNQQRIWSIKLNRTLKILSHGKSRSCYCCFIIVHLFVSNRKQLGNTSQFQWQYKIIGRILVEHTKSFINLNIESTTEMV